MCGQGVGNGYSELIKWLQSAGKFAIPAETCSILQVELLNPQPGYFEIEPEGLWRKIVKVITESIRGT